MNFKKYNKFIANNFLIILLIVSTFLMIYKITDESFWADETASYGYAKAPYITLLQGLDKVHPPLYYILLKTTVLILGDSDLSLRLLSVLFGLTSIVIMYYFTKDIFDIKTARITSILYATSYFLIYYAQEARSYTLLISLSLLSVYLFYKCLNKNKITYWVLYSLVSILAIYTHYFMGFILLFEGIYFLIFIKKNKKIILSWILSSLSIVLAFSYWIFNVLLKSDFLNPKTNQSNISWIVKPNLDSIYQLFNNFTGNLIGHNIFALLVFLTFLLLFILNKDSFKEKGYILLYFFFPLTLVFLISYFYTPLFIVRYLSIIFPPFVIIIGRSVSKIDYKPLIYILLVILVISNSFALYNLYTYHQKEGWREAANWIDKNGENDSLVIMHWIGPQVLTKYLKSDLDIQEFSNGGNLVTIDYASKVDSLIENEDNIILVYSHSRDPNEFILKDIQREFRLLDSKKFNGITIYKLNRISEKVTPVSKESINYSRDNNNNNGIYSLYSNTDYIIFNKSKNKNQQLYFEFKGNGPTPYSIELLDGQISNNLTFYNKEWKEVILPLSLSTNSIKIHFINDIAKRYQNGTYYDDRNVFIRDIKILEGAK